MLYHGRLELASQQATARSVCSAPTNWGLILRRHQFTKEAKDFNLLVATNETAVKSLAVLAVVLHFDCFHLIVLGCFWCSFKNLNSRTENF